MTTYLINYDLRKPGRNYDDLYSALKSYKYIHPLESCWVIETSSTAVQVRDYLKSKMDANDQLLVVASGKVGAWNNLTSTETQWLKDNL